MATEAILMAATAAGGDRQDLHERIRRHSQDAAGQVKSGGENDLLIRLREDGAFEKVDFEKVLDPRGFVGRAPEQVDDFLARVIAPIREKHAARTTSEVEVRV